MSLTAFKVFITVSYTGTDAPAAHKTIRRFSAKPGTTLAEFRKILVEEILRRPEGSVVLTVSYKDVDGDVVEVASELEWAEALQQHSGAVSPVTAIPIIIDATLEGSDPLSSSMIIPCQSFASATSSAVPSSTVREASVGTAPTATAEAASGTISVPLSSAQMQTDAPAPESATVATSTAPTESPQAPPNPARITVTNVHADGTTTSHTSSWPSFSASDAPLLGLLSQLFSCDAGKELLDPYRRTNFGSLLRRTVDPWTDSLKLDIYLSQVRNYASTQATGLMASSDASGFERALSLLKAAVAVFPEDATLHYHLACAMSLTKASAAAVVDELRAALAKGYKDLQHFMVEGYLTAVATSPEMLKLLEEHLGRYVVQLLAIYPHLPIATAKAVLARFGNNVHAAAGHVIDMAEEGATVEPESLQ